MKTLDAPNHTGAQRLFILIAGLWVGSLLTVGYLVAPAIFSTMSDRQAAGMVAGSIFRLEAYLSVTVCIGLIVLANLLVKRGLHQFRIIRWLLLANAVLLSHCGFYLYSLDELTKRSRSCPRYASNAFSLGYCIWKITWRL